MVLQCNLLIKEDKIFMLKMNEKNLMKVIKRNFKENNSTGNTVWYWQEGAPPHNFGLFRQV